MGDPYLKETLCTMNVVSLRCLFSKLFNIPSFFEIIENFINSLDYDDHNISNVMQTDFWKRKISAISKERTLILPLLVYFDDFEVLNPIGSKSGLYKIGGVYTKLMCLPKIIESQLLYTYSAVLFFTGDRKNFGDKQVFTPLIDELNYLQDEGIKVSHKHYDTVKIIPILFCGDNLGLNGILSFTECFTANFRCRFCLIHHNVTKTLTIKANEAMYRTRENYDAHVIVNNMSLTGIKQNSTFNNLHNFHVIDNFSVDYAHDFLEGTCRYGMTNIIYNLIHKYKWFSLEQLNSRIKSFNASLKSSNKIGFITLKRKNLGHLQSKC